MTNASDEQISIGASHGSHSLSANSGACENGQSENSSTRAFEDLYSIDKGTLRIKEGCTYIPRKAFMYREDITSLELPDSLEEIGEYAFAFTSISIFSAPQSLRRICSNAFYQCKLLCRVICNEALQTIEEHAFRESGLDHIKLSLNLQFVGKRIFRGTPLARAFSPERLVIPCENKYYLCDSDGGLYRILHTDCKDDEAALKMNLLEMLNENIEQHAPLAETVRIEADAYRGLALLKQVSFPEGLKSIGQRGLAYCKSLAQVQLPSTLAKLEEDAFYLSPLQCINIPANLTEVGECALITRAENSSVKGPNIPNLTIDKDCDNFRLVNGFLCFRHEEGSVEALVYCGTSNTVLLPKDVEFIGPYALATGTPVDEITIQSEHVCIHKLAFPAKRAIAVFRVELDEAMFGSNYLELHFPPHIPLNLSYDDMFQRLGAHGNMVLPHAGRMAVFPQNSEDEILAPGNQMRTLDLAFIADQSDQAVYRMADQIERARLIFKRLQCPQFLSKTNEERYRSSLRRTCEELCVHFVQRADWRSVDYLLEESLLDRESLSRATERISQIGDASLTGYLLEAKQRYFDVEEIDFEL